MNGGGHDKPIRLCMLCCIHEARPIMGGAARGDISAKIDAEVAHSGLSANEIGPKVHISLQTSRRTKWSCIQRYFYNTPKGNSSDSWPSCYVWLRFLSEGVWPNFKLTAPILNECLGLRCQTHPQNHERVTRKDEIFSVVSILFKFHQLLPGVCHCNCDYLLRRRLRICPWMQWGSGSPTCRGNSPTLWIQHQNAKQWNGTRVDIETILGEMLV